MRKGEIVHRQTVCIRKESLGRNIATENFTPDHLAYSCREADKAIGVLNFFVFQNNVFLIYNSIFFADGIQHFQAGTISTVF